GIMRARSAVRRITRFDPSPFAAQLAAEVADFEPSAHLTPRAVKRLDLCSQFALASSLLAVADSGIELATEELCNVGVCIGSALGGAAYAEEQHGRYLAGGTRAIEPQVALQVFVGAGSCNVAIALGLTGYSTSNADSCAS